MSQHEHPHGTAYWKRRRLLQLKAALQSLCERCHNQTKRLFELRGYGLEVDKDGYPTDPKHPFNQRI
jgi:hypothetical protein